MTKKLIFGLSGYDLKEEERDFFLLNESKIYGFILFKRNIKPLEPIESAEYNESAEAARQQLKKLVGGLKNLYPNNPALIFIDQEGGRVARIKAPIIKDNYPSAQTFANIYDNEGAEAAVKKTKENYKNLMQDLKDFGIDSPCAPVADLSYSDADNVVGDRSFGNQVTKVVTLVKAAIEGIENAGGIPIIKHMPGHGRATVDSHHDLPTVDDSIEELNETDFKVFKELKDVASHTMTAHIIFTALDPDLPVTLSKKAINFIKNDLGFKGKIITDAIEMKALHQGVDVNNKKDFHRSLGVVARAALDAGCDIVLHCTGDLAQMQEIAEVV